jgi:hypothetical protein
VLLLTSYPIGIAVLPAPTLSASERSQSTGGSRPVGKDLPSHPTRGVFPKKQRDGRPVPTLSEVISPHIL